MYKMTNEEYKKYIAAREPKSPLAGDLVKAFLAGGAICTIGQIVLTLWQNWVADSETALTATSITMVFLGVAATALGFYDKIAKFGGAGTLVPITGFANAMCSPAMEFKSEGIVAGLSAKMFVIAGPVIVFGISASVVYGILYYLLA
ncbi:MAG: stage V sporulation protein AC [Oscillospiraceae bacterium]|jgi:stage V sporulation protein AC|nr:stage V sporulation protein AC [Oscillospiraceae bacterium]